MPGEGFGAPKEGLSNQTHRSSSDPAALLARKSHAHPAVLSGAHPNTIGADKNDDTTGFVAEVRRLGVTPHMVQNTARPEGSAIGGRTTRHKGYTQSINARRGIEKVCGWIKQFAGLRQFKLRGEDNVSAVVGLHVIAYNLIRLGNILKPVMEVA